MTYRPGLPWHAACLSQGVSNYFHQHQEIEMRWTKPEAEIVAVTMEVTAYVATL